MKATCIRCGASKKLPWHTCGQCGFSPSGEDLVKSVYCSVGRFTHDPEEETEFEIEVDRISQEIQAGREIHYDESELQRLREQQMDVETASKGAFVYLLRVFLPAIIFLAVLYLIVALLEKWRP